MSLIAHNEPTNRDYVYDACRKKIEIPTDVVDLIIEDVLDRQTLKACSLTCRAWLHRSRVHLHHSFTIRIDTILSNHGRLFYFDDLAKLPAILHYSQELKVQTVGYGDAKNYEQFHSLLRNIVTQLSHVRKLTIASIDLSRSPFSFLNMAVLHTWSRLLPNVRELDILRCTLSSHRDALVFASEFPHLQSLRLDNVSARAPYDVPIFASALSFAPRTISLTGCCSTPVVSSAIVAHLQSHRKARESLKVLCLATPLETGPEEDLAIFAHVAGAYVQDLHVVVREQCQAPDFKSNLRADTIREAIQSLQKFDALHTLRLSFRRHHFTTILSLLHGPDINAIQSNSSLYCEILAGATAPTVRELVLNFAAQDIERRDIDTLEGVILGDKWRGLTTVRFAIEGHFNRSQRDRDLIGAWSGAFSRLRAHRAVLFNFYSKTNMNAESPYVRH